MSGRPHSPILVAEDDENIARLVSFKLGKAGYAVSLARDGQEALTLLPEQPWRLVILDVMMPHHDGWSVLRKLRAVPALAEVPVLMLTARSQSRDLADAAALGASRVLRKPFDPGELARLVGQMIEEAGK